jgi:hypothetical protein
MYLLLQILFLHLTSNQIISYHHGGNETNCWYNENPIPQSFCETQIGSFHHIHILPPSPSNQQQQPSLSDSSSIILLNPDQISILTSTSTDVTEDNHPTNDLSLTNTTNQVFINEFFTIEATLDVLSPNKVNIIHANFHACLVKLGYCTPDVKITPGLVSQSIPLNLGEVEANTQVQFQQRFMLDQIGEWTIIAHVSLLVTYNNSQSPVLESIPNTLPLHQEIKIEVAYGEHISVKQRAKLVQVENWAQNFILVLASMGIILALVTAIFIWYQRSHWVIIASSVKLSLLIVVGCILGFIGAIMLLPPSFSMLISSKIYNNGIMYCNSRIWLLILAFDSILIPLTLKTWRVTILFNPKSQFKRIAITDQRLLHIFGIVVMADVFLCMIWTSVVPLHALAIPSIIQPDESFFATCAILHGPPRIQLGLELFVIFSHGISLAWVALLGQRMRSAFRDLNTTSHTTNGIVVRDKMKFCQFDESDAVSLTLLSMLFITIFAIGLQYTVKDSPTALALMTCGACIWTGYFTLLVMFWPKFKQIMKVEEDGITERNESMIMQARRSLLRSSGRLSGSQQHHHHHLSTSSSNSRSMVVNSLSLPVPVPATIPDPLLSTIEQTTLVPPPPPSPPPTCGNMTTTKVIDNNDLVQMDLDMEIL